MDHSGRTVQKESQALSQTVLNVFSYLYGNLQPSVFYVNVVIFITPLGLRIEKISPFEADFNEILITKEKTI